MEAYMGVVMYFGGNFAPKNFQMCMGQLLSISQSSALFAILGTTFGGNGMQTFQLPHLGGRAALGTGQAPGVGHNYQIGEISGTENVTLNTSQMPAHVHSVSIPYTLQACTGVAAADESADPIAGGCLASVQDADGKSSPVIYAPAGSGTPVNLAGGTIAGSTGPAGQNLPFSIMQPYLGLTAIICTAGLFPSRN
ncbi:phage tail protein [Sphingomonas sp. R-74633]|uniref:phage tail protein n=1 Tax=Sphingomonas sp. R-74633 TaxID=2751188 RepID=UPI001C552BC1|nr:tail fiber protein [Sphingomonas sp. R-74633]